MGVDNGVLFHYGIINYEYFKTNTTENVWTF